MFEIIRGDVEDRPWPKRARVEYRAYERPQAPFGLFEGGADFGRIGNVARHRNQAVWRVRGHGSKPISAPGQHRNPIPLAREPRG
jgi:hypothetical protein